MKTISEIKAEACLSEPSLFIEKFESDQRAGVKKLVEKARKQILEAEKEKARLFEMASFERECFEKGFELVAGVDEVGRGPYAGPVVASCVILPKNCEILGLNDSKKLSAKKRNELFLEIQKKAISIGIGVVDNKEIDQLNILKATFKAMKIAIEKGSVKPEILLVDAVKIPDVLVEQVSIIKGDSKSISIAAASVVAKVTRDKMMEEYSKIYKEYGFETNMGYGSKFHEEAIRKHGLCEIHRRSFTHKFL